MAKAVCIIGVVLQHAGEYVYKNNIILESTFFTVALFIMIGGYNVMSSWINRGTVIMRGRLWKIFFPYVIATIIYTLYRHHFLDVSTLIDYLLHFNASGPLYYVAVYMQLCLISPFLIGLIIMCNRRCKWLRFALAWTVILTICYLTVHRSNVFDIIIGGGNLFGGSWLMFWFAGMCFRAWDIQVRNLKVKYVVFLLQMALLIVWEWVFIVKRYNSSLAPIFHGKQIGMTWANTAETMLLFFWFKEFVELLEIISKEKARRILLPLKFVGRKSLPIFLYHMLFLGIYRDIYNVDEFIGKAACLTFIICGPILLDWMIHKIMRSISALKREISIDGVSS